MADMIECLKEDLSGFNAQITDLDDQRQQLVKQIDDLNSQIQSIQPLCTYAESLLKRVQQQTPVKAKRTSSKAGADDPLA